MAAFAEGDKIWYKELEFQDSTGYGIPGIIGKIWEDSSGILYGLYLYLTPCAAAPVRRYTPYESELTART